MNDAEAIHQLTELLESAIMDFEKLGLQPAADIYKAELEKIKHARISNN
jgi:hypothetical protein